MRQRTWKSCIPAVLLSLATGVAGQSAETRSAQAKKLPGLKLAAATDDDLASLEGLTELQVLDHNGSQITDAALEHLKSLKDLSTIELRHTEVTQAGVATLRGSMPKLDIRMP